MKNNLLRLLLVALCGFSLPALGQGTAFTYQGQLTVNSSTPNANYDLTFAVFSASNGIGQVGETLTNLDVGVTNGLFTTTLDFGPGIFTGSARWLEIGVRTNGSAGAFLTLNPLQPVTAAPYAIVAGSVSNLLGTVPDSSLGGTYSNAIVLSNAANILGGNGAGVNNVNAVQLGGLLPSRFWQTVGNSELNATTNYFGTTDNNPAELHVNGARALRLEPGSSPNVIGGFSGNTVTSGATGATISGGGGSGATNRVTSSGGTVSGGVNNTVSNLYGTVAGGIDNVADGNASSVAGGAANTAGQPYSKVGGGQGNVIQAGTEYSVISGGEDNVIQASGFAAVIGSGNNNTNNGNAGTIVGGQNNFAAGYYQPAIGGGYASIASNSYATIAGGFQNTNLGNAGTIVGGQQNLVGNFNQATVGGGYNNQALNDYATVPGGFQNVASCKYSFAAGQQAKALHQGAFVWADSQGPSFSSTANNQFLVSAQGGVGVNTRNPNGTSLYVVGGRSNGFNNSMSVIENQNTVSNTSPALRVLVDGGTPMDGALSVSANIAPTTAGLLAEFGNRNSFVVDITNNGTIYAGGFVGDGSGLTGVANVLTLGGNAIESGTGLDGVAVETNLYMTANSLYLRGDNGIDHNHGLAYCGGGITNFPNSLVQPNGPVLWGYTGGALAVLKGGAQAMLSWNNSGVTINGTLDATNLSVKGVVSWQAVSSATQAVPNAGYVATSGAQVTVTLPTSLNPGDIVRVSGGGSGGWKVAQDAGQVIFGNFLQSGNFRNTWKTTSPPQGAWYAVASALDGTHLVAVSYEGGTSLTPVITSTNSGSTWITNNNAPDTAWSAVTSSADGTHLVAGGAETLFDSPGALYTSANSGITWVSNTSTPLEVWHSLACSYDGTHVYAGAAGGPIYISVNSGSTFTASNPTNDGSWSLACSSNGSNVWAADYTSGYLFHSVNAGATWSELGGFNDPGEAWDSITCSADGTKVLAAGIYPGQYTAPMWYSGNSGSTWSVMNVGTATTNGWCAVASSASGQYLEAVACYDNDLSQIYYSTNTGSTWTAAGPTQNWQGVAISGDGTKMVAVSTEDEIYVSQDPLQTSTSSGTAGALTGGEASATELQYTTNSGFVQISHFGNVFAQ